MVTWARRTLGSSSSVELGGQSDPFGTNGLGDELNLDRFLLGHKDDGVTLDHCLAAQCPAILDVGGGQAYAAAVADGSVFNLNPAATTAPLSAAGQVQGDAGLDRRVG